MGNRLCDHSVNIIAYKKNGINYAMCCAWTMMADYDKLLCLLGSQSITGKNIKKGDIIGFSSLNSTQMNIAEAIGDKHSDEINKLESIEYFVKNNAILIKNARTNIVCEVIDVKHLEGIENDNLIYLKALDIKENEGKFLHYEDFYA